MLTPELFQYDTQKVNELDTLYIVCVSTYYTFYDSVSTTGNRKNYQTLVSEDTPKFIKVVKGVFATLCGAESRIFNI